MANQNKVKFLTGNVNYSAGQSASEILDKVNVVAGQLMLVNDTDTDESILVYDAPLDTGVSRRIVSTHANKVIMTPEDTSKTAIAALGRYENNTDVIYYSSQVYMHDKHLGVGIVVSDDSANLEVAGSANLNGTVQTQQLSPYADSKYNLGLYNYHWATTYTDGLIASSSNDYISASSAATGAYLGDGTLSLSSATPTIQFHFANDATTTSSIIEQKSGILNLASKVQIGTYNTAGDDLQLYVNGKSHFVGTVQLQDAIYFANGTDYYVDNTGNGSLETLGVNGVSTDYIFYVNGSSGLHNITHLNANDYNDGTWTTGATGTQGDGTNAGTLGTSILSIGNNIERSTSLGVGKNNSQGYLRLYGTGTGYGELYYDNTYFRPNSDIYFTNNNASINGWANGIRGQVGANDYWRIGGGATASNAGYSEWATGDDATEPLYVRQYSGVFSTLNTTLTLLDASHNTIIPNSLTVGTSTSQGANYKFYVNGDSYFNGNTYHNGIDYFANNTTYYINNSAQALLANITIGAVGTTLDTTNKLYVNGTGLFTGNVTIKKGSPNLNIIASDTTTQTITLGDSQYTYAALTSYDATTYGANLAIQSGGIVAIGSGESATALLGAIGTSVDSETLYALSDGAIYLESNGQTIANRIGVSIDSSGNLYPVKTESVNNNAQTLGTTSARWKALYIGSSNSYGGTAQPIYWNAGVPTACTSTVGSSTKPVYMNSGTITVCDNTLANDISGNAATASKLNNSLTIVNGKSTSTSYDGSSATTITIDKIVTQDEYDSLPATKTSDGVTYYITDGAGEDLYIEKSIGTAAGDLIYWSAASTPTRLGIGTSGQALMVSSSGLPYWGTVSTSDTKVTNTLNTSTKFYVTGTTSATTNTGTQIFDTGVYVDTTAGKLVATSVYGAVWNDYAEFRKSDVTEPGRVVVENGDGTLSLSTERLQRGAEVVSDTFGFAIGETDECKTPIAATGRVLVYYSGDIRDFKPGYPVCSGPNGTVSVMSEEEEMRCPSRIIGTVSEIPTYEEWGTGKVKVNGRIWIRIR